MSSVLNITDDNFETEVLKSEIPVLIDFWAEWCGPCKVLGPIVDDVAPEFDGKVKFTKKRNNRSYVSVENEVIN